MLGTTLTLKAGGVGGTAKVLNRIKDDGYGAEYFLRENDGTWKVIVNHSSKGGRDRHFIEVRRTIFATSTTPEETAKASFVIDATPQQAFALGKNACGLPLTALVGYDGSTDGVMMGLINWDS